MKIKITEQQFHYLINEGSGINKDITAIANAVINDIVENHLYDLQEEFDDSGYTDFDDFIYDFFDDIGTDSVWYETADGQHGEQYYSFYYEVSNSKGKYSHDYGEVQINYYGLEKVLNRADYYFSQIDGANKAQWVKDSLYEYLFPILTHELTHSIDNEGEAQGKWLGGCYKGNEEDLRDILYVFSENEMNARIGSMSGVVQSMIHMIYMDEKPSKEDYASFIQEVLDDDDLSVHYMSLLLDMMHRELERLEECKTSKERSEFKKYSLLYDLFRNDNRLQNNRTLKRMFNTNSMSAFDYVYKFYVKLFDNYKKRLMRAAYYMLENNNNIN